MLIGYPAPPVSGIALANGNWLTDGNGQQLIDGKPARVARIQTTTAHPSITLTYASAWTPKIIALLGLTCAPGTAITAISGGGGALGGNSAAGAATQLPDGSVACWIVTGGSVATNSVKVTINAGGTFDVGELVVMPAVEIAHETDWAFSPIDPSVIGRTRGGQPTVSARRSYRQLRVAFVAAVLAEVRGGGLAGGMDWDQLTAKVAGGQRTVAIPRWRALDGAIDVTELHRTALYGLATPGGQAHLGGNYYGSDNGWTFTEVPPL